MQSRYYDPEVGRFINADNVLASDELLGNNLFVYCGNNPVNRADPSGHDWWHWAIAAAVVVVAAVAVVATAGGAAAAIAAVTAVASGVAASSTAATVAAGAFIGSSTALAVSAYSAYSNSRSADEFAAHGEGAMYSTLGGAAWGGISASSLSSPQKSTPAQEAVCFVAGTNIRTANGFTAIEEIEAGDMVWASNPETGEIALKRVVQTFENQADELVHLTIGREEIVCTNEHPFYSPVKGWTAACKLRAGDILVTVNGEYVVIEKVQHEILEAPVTVYNFEVQEYHTYFVGATSILVHNTCSAPITNSQTKAQAQSLGYSKVHGRSSHGQAVYYNPKASSGLQYISADVDSHNGGAWKAAASIHDLASKRTRTGTYSWNLNIRIGD